MENDTMTKPTLIGCISSIIQLVGSIIDGFVLPLSNLQYLIFY